jgi:hypothetical protein
MFPEEKKVVINKDENNVTISTENRVTEANVVTGLQDVDR